jgi:hypothetical protein
MPGDHAVSQINLLYIYDVDDWSIHNVGKLWFSLLDSVQTTFSRQRT